MNPETSSARSEEWLNALIWTEIASTEFEKLNESDKLHRVRHSAAHVMASAIQRLYPSAQFAAGPAIHNGFFYDFKIDSNEELRVEDLPKIQEVIDEILAQKLPFQKTLISKTEAIDYFRSVGQPYKVEILGNIASEQVSLFRHGHFVDLCSGPHVPHTGWCRHMQVLSLSAAHWKKDEKIPSLRRIHGTAWITRPELRQHLLMLEEAKARDHRVLGPKLELFSFHEWATSALWHPNGLVVRRELEKLWRDMISEAGYVEILNPLLYRKELFEMSGHWTHYQDDMFLFQGKEDEPVYGLKPMNCPDTMLYFQTKKRSYRELPLRIAQGQILHRNETSGALHGLMRSRNFVQDDAHLFIEPEHIFGEAQSLMQMLHQTYSLLGLKYRMRLSTRPKEFLGAVEVWDQAEEALRKVLEASHPDFSVGEGEGAFYGPKIDAIVYDSLGRQWQCGTVQLDFQLPERFDLTYTSNDGTPKRPIVIHRAIFGSFERFIAILIEHFGGSFPTWLSPIQVAVLPISQETEEYAATVEKKLKAAGIRAEINSEGSISYRIRRSETFKIPYMLIVGPKESELGTVTVRRHGMKEQTTLSADQFLADLQQDISIRKLDAHVKNLSLPPEVAPSAPNEEY